MTEPVNLAPDFVGMDYDSQVRNNHSYAGDYLFYVTMEYSDTVEKGKIIRQTPEAGEVIEEGSTIDLVVSRARRWWRCQRGRLTRTARSSSWRRWG